MDIHVYEYERYMYNMYIDVYTLCLIRCMYHSHVKISDVDDRISESRKFGGIFFSHLTATVLFQKKGHVNWSSLSSMSFLEDF